MFLTNQHRHENELQCEYWFYLVHFLDMPTKNDCKLLILSYFNTIIFMRYRKLVKLTSYPQVGSLLKSLINAAFADLLIITKRIMIP